MQHSETRFLTTHAGSLPRLPSLVELLVRQSRREPLDLAALQATVAASTRRVVRAQLACGVDVGNDGEQARESFFTYVQHRMSGFGGESDRPLARDMREFAGRSSRSDAEFGTLAAVSLARPPRAVGAIEYRDRAPLEAECARLLAIQAEAQPGFAETFITAPSPGIIVTAMSDDYYGNTQTYLNAAAEALAIEYRYIVAQGFVLQIDAPDLAMERHRSFAERPLDDFLGFASTTVAAINHSLSGIPPERVRLHVCWGNYEGPHIYDVPLDAILAVLYQARVGALLISMANPRHAHEHRAFQRFPLPDGMLLIAGLIDTTTNYVEHPQVVADRLEAVTRAVGDPRRVLASPDCGFDTSAGFGWVLDSVVWEKLRALRAGAERASTIFFGPG